MTDSTGLKTADQDAGGRVVSLDGVRYGILDSGGTSWRLGTVNPLCNFLAAINSGFVPGVNNKSGKAE